MGYGGVVYAFITPEGERSHDMTRKGRWERGQVFPGCFVCVSYIMRSLGLFVGRGRVSGNIVHLAALAGLRVAVGRLGQGDTDRGTATGTALLALALIESLAGNNAVDFCSTCEIESWQLSTRYVPVRMFWKASSTLLASRAEVSMKERLFSPGERKELLVEK
jgi:hypothetical protein